MLIYIQNVFDKEICNKLFGDLSNHIYQKWIDSDFNLVNFLSKLDNQNKLHFMKWAKYKRKCYIKSL